MRPRILRKSNARVVSLPTSRTALRSVDTQREPAESPQLWVGTHILSLKGAATLEKLATRAQRFTPRVSLVAPDGLLLEVKGSLHLFEGVDGLLRAFSQDCEAIGIESTVALAPTPLAAMVAARVGKPFVVTNKAQLVGRLTALPLGPLRWPDDVVERLARMGVRTIGQALRLPRAGFARRFGPAHLAELDRLTGRSADLRHHFQPRERFRRRRELTYEMENNATILAAFAPLLADLGKFLELRQSGITELECRLRHRHAPPSTCVLRLAAPVADVARITELLGERLNALVLPEPVRSCELRSSLPVLRVLSCDSLWQPGEYGGSSGPESPQLVERLRARLGHEAVYGLQMLPGHRPERAWAMCEPVTATRPVDSRRAGASGPTVSGSAGARGVGGRGGPNTVAPGARSLELVPPWAAFRRPLWLLPSPQQLEEIEGVPRRRGTLRFFGDVERIETGWWDGGEIGRDYYTVFDIYGVQLWIFRERADPHRWFLHGVFG
ncbi:MAG: protein ImuB [Gammaproteobacteria bacterium]|nr:protein ImuB [Gammaproteobacteria bacterium]